jgi:NAD(P)H-hydrate repair Nnr-like enzyme with NAD(P)H-hydrate epimerase domain
MSLMKNEPTGNSIFVFKPPTMKIFSARQIKEADKITLEKQEISSTDLMERAASLVFDEIHKGLRERRSR